MTNKDLGPDPTSDNEVVTRGYGDGRYRRTADPIKFPWDSEVIPFPWNVARANGYGDVPGGIMVPRAIVLTEIVIRTAGVGVAVGGTGNLVLTVYLGNVDSIGTSLGTISVPAGASNVVTTTSLNIPKNACLRANVAMGATTGNGLHIHYRGIDQ